MNFSVSVWALRNSVKTQRVCVAKTLTSPIDGHTRQRLDLVASDSGMRGERVTVLSARAAARRRARVPPNR
jgi:hypothetical protein